MSSSLKGFSSSEMGRNNVREMQCCNTSWVNWVKVGGTDMTSPTALQITFVTQCECHSPNVKQQAKYDITVRVSGSLRKIQKTFFI